MKKEKVIYMLEITGLVYSIAFIVTTLTFVLFNQYLFAFFNELSQMLFPFLPPANEKSQFYRILTISMMSGISTCSFLIYKNPEQYLPMIIPLSMMKFTSSLCGLIVFMWGLIYAGGANNLSNLVIFIIDFPLGVWVVYLYYLYQKCDE